MATYQEYRKMLTQAVMALEADFEQRLYSNEFLNYKFVSKQLKRVGFNHKDINQSYKDENISGFTFLLIEEEGSNKVTAIVSKTPKKQYKQFDRLEGKRNVLNLAIRVYDQDKQNPSLNEHKIVLFKDDFESYKDFTHRLISSYFKKHNLLKD